MSEVKDKTVYLSGPMTGVADHNREAFQFAEIDLYMMGARYVFNPCEHWRRENGELPDWLTYQDYMRKDLHMLTRGNFDVLVLLDDFVHSKGAQVERTVAHACGIKVRTLAELEGECTRDFWTDK